MKQYLCRHSREWSNGSPAGEYWLSSPELSKRLADETLRSIVNLDYAVTIGTGTGSATNYGPGPDSMYRWAQSDCWRVVYFPHGGGAEAYVIVDGVGWTVDVDDMMPHSVWVALLTALGAPLVTQSA